MDWLWDALLHLCLPAITPSFTRRRPVSSWKTHRASGFTIQNGTRRIRRTFRASYSVQSAIWRKRKLSLPKRCLVEQLINFRVLVMVRVLEGASICRVIADSRPRLRNARPAAGSSHGGTGLFQHRGAVLPASRG